MFAMQTLQPVLYRFLHRIGWSMAAALLAVGLSTTALLAAAPAQEKIRRQTFAQDPDVGAQVG